MGGRPSEGESPEVGEGGRGVKSMWTQCITKLSNWFSQSNQILNEMRKKMLVKVSEVECSEYCLIVLSGYQKSL